MALWINYQLHLLPWPLLPQEVQLLAGLSKLIQLALKHSVTAASACSYYHPGKVFQPPSISLPVKVWQGSSLSCCLLFLNYFFFIWGIWGCFLSFLSFKSQGPYIMHQISCLSRATSMWVFFPFTMTSIIFIHFPILFMLFQPTCQCQYSAVHTTLISMLLIT